MVVAVSNLDHDGNRDFIREKSCAGLLLLDNLNNLKDCPAVEEYLMTTRCSFGGKV